MELRYDSTGKIITLVDDGRQRMPNENATGEVRTVDFDPATNAELLADLPLRHYLYRVVSGALYRDGALVTIAAPGPAYSERLLALTLARGLKAYNALASPTNAQTVAAVKANNRLTLILGRLMLRELEEE